MANKVDHLLTSSQVFAPQGTTTATTYIAPTAQPSTVTVSAQGSSSGTVIIYTNSAGYQSYTTTYGGYSSTTTVASASDSVSGTVEVSSIEVTTVNCSNFDITKRYSSHKALRPKRRGWLRRHPLPQSLSVRKVPIAER